MDHEADQGAVAKPVGRRHVDAVDQGRASAGSSTGVIGTLQMNFFFGGINRSSPRRFRRIPAGKVSIRVALTSAMAPPLLARGLAEDVEGRRPDHS